LIEIIHKFTVLHNQFTLTELFPNHQGTDDSTSKVSKWAMQVCLGYHVSYITIKKLL